MNAPFPLHDQQFDAMSGNADKWRGECIQQFAALEQIVESLLRQLKLAPRHGKQVDTGLPVGAAFKHLRELSGSKGPFAAKGKAISNTLAELAPWFEWRAHLTHGDQALWRGRKPGHWLLTYSHRPNGEDTVRTYAITWDDAQWMKRILVERSTTLAENARSLANAVRAA